VANADDARAQIAMELHDGVGATLTAAQLLTQLMRRDEHAPAEASIALLERTLRDGLVDLRLALFSMDDDAAGWDDVFARLRRHVGDVCETAGLRHHFTARGESLTTPTAAVRLALFRVTQEALINVVRHAHATNVVFDVEVGCGHVAITIEDDGAGMSDACDGVDHRGILNMKRRVERLGGALAFEQPTERGTRLRMTLPSH
jgi:signal transduction histidine kinase